MKFYKVTAVMVTDETQDELIDWVTDQLREHHGLFSVGAQFMYEVPPKGSSDN